MTTGLDYLSKKLIGQKFDGTKIEHGISHAYEIVGIGCDGMINIKYLDEDMPTFDRINLEDFFQHRILVERKLN